MNLNSPRQTGPEQEPARAVGYAKVNTSRVNGQTKANSASLFLYNVTKYQKWAAEWFARGRDKSLKDVCFSSHLRPLTLWPFRYTSVCSDKSSGKFNKMIYKKKRQTKNTCERHCPYAWNWICTDLFPSIDRSAVYTVFVCVCLAAHFLTMTSYK